MSLPFNQYKSAGKLVPAIIELMLDHPETDWGPACYPVVDAD